MSRKSQYHFNTFQDNAALMMYSPVCPNTIHFQVRIMQL